MFEKINPQYSTSNYPGREETLAKIAEKPAQQPVNPFFRLKAQAMVHHIDQTLGTKNLSPSERQHFLEAKKYLNGMVSATNQEELKSQVLNMLMKKLGEGGEPFVGEMRKGGQFYTPQQEGSVVTPESTGPRTEIRSFVDNWNLGDGGFLRDLLPPNTGGRF